MSSTTLLPLTPLRMACRRARCRSIQPHASSRAWSSTPPQWKQEPPVSESTQDLLNKLKRDSRIRDGAANLGRGGVGSVGPFPMGVGMGSATSKTWKSWRELNVRGKAVRVVAQTGNLSVIIIGGTLFVVLFYALTSELFSSDSPTVLQNRAISMISAHEGIRRHLLKPYTFSHNASGLTSSRRTSPIQQQHMRHPKTGKEHLILRFWVHGRGINEPEGWLEWSKSQARLVKSYTWDPAVAAIEQAMPREPEKDQVEQPVAAEAAAPAGQSSWGGFFGRLKPQRSTSVSMGKEPPPAGTFKDGEARADYVRDTDGKYRLLSLTVDVPSSSSSFAQRVVVYMDTTDIAQEGLLEGREARMTL